MSRAGALIMSCHPVPTLAVTTISCCLAIGVGVAPWTAVLLVAAVLAGQLSIGWGNDVLDTERDRRAGRTDKPLATDAVERGVAVVAAGVALLAAVILSVKLGGPAGGAAGLIVVCGWAYNLGLRATVLSFLPYLLAFGALPAVATFALPDRPWPTWWATAAGAMLGVSAHLLNVIPDLKQDAVNGIRGLPHRWGARWSTIVAAFLVAATAAALVMAPTGSVPGWRWAAFGLMVAGALAATVMVLRGSTGRLIFNVLVVGAVADTVLFVVSGARSIIAA